MNSTKHWSAVIAVCCAAVVASAATVTLTTDSLTGFTKKEGWSSGNPPEAGNDYVVADGHYLRGDYSEGFAGDSLQFGIVGGSEGVFFKEHQGTHTFTKLILANGLYRTWLSSSGQYGRIKGAVEVTSPESAPFRLHSTHDGDSSQYNTYWDAAITGAEGTGLRIGPHPKALLSKGQTIFTGDNSGYLGSIVAYGTNMVFAFTTGNSLGGALSSFKADALMICDGTTLECQSQDADVTLSSSLSRGVTVDATGGRLSIPSGKSLRLEWPLTGTGPLYKVGAGKLTLAAAMSLTASDPAAACLTVSNGCLEFAAGFANSGGRIYVPSSCEVSVAAGDEVTVANLALDGAIRISYDADAQTSGVLVLDGSCTPTWPIPVYTPDVRGVRVPFLKVPTSLKTVTAGDFVKPADFAATKLPSATFTVETEGSMQTVYAQTLDLVTVSETFNGAANDRAYFTYGSEAGRWSDGKLPHSGADYQVGAGKTLYAQGLSGAYTFPGESLSFVGTSSKRAILSFDGASLTSFTGDIRTTDYVRMFPTVNNGTEFHLCGQLYVGGTPANSDNGLDFRANANDITVCVDSVVSGSGGMCFQPYAANQESTYFFTAENLYKGTYFVYMGRASSKVTLKFATAGSWGANPPAAQAMGVLLQSGSGCTAELYPAGSQTVSHPNRGLMLLGTGIQVRVDAGETFEFNAPISFGGTSESFKAGGGTWAIGGTTSITAPASEPPSLTVSEGFIRADNARALVDVSVDVEDGAGIAAKYRPGETSDAATYGMIVTNAARFAVNGNTLKFKVATGGERVRGSERIALLTVPEATAAALAAKTFKLEHDDSYGRNAELLTDTVTVSSIPCVRYSCKFINGFRVLVR